MPDSLSLNNINANTIDIDISGGGTGVTLPQATTTTAGLMSADDKAKMIRQGGNAFGTTMRIGTNDNKEIKFKINGTDMATFDFDNRLAISGVKNVNTPDNSLVGLSISGTLINRNVADSNTALTVNQQNASSTGNIANFQFGGTTVSKVTKDGFVFGTRLGVNSTGANPQYPLDINSGTNPISILIGKFSQNNGSVQIENGTVAPNNFAPTIRGTANGSFPWGILVQGQGAASYSRAGVILRALDAAGTGPVTSGNTFQLENNTTSQLSVDYQGAVTMPNLSGTGDRMVTADSAGTLSATTEVRSGSYTPTITGPDSYTLHGFRYSRIGDIVHVSGAVEVSSGSVGALSFNLGLPVSMSSTFTDMFDITGVVSGLQVLGDCCVFADIINNEADVKFTTTQTLSTVFLQFDYIIQ